MKVKYLFFRNNCLFCGMIWKKKFVEIVWECFIYKIYVGSYVGIKYNDIFV